MDKIIVIEGKEFKLKRTFRGLIVFEDITGKKIGAIEDTTGDMIKFFYSLLQGANKDTFIYTLDNFLDILDLSPELFSQFITFLTETSPSKFVIEKKSKKGKIVH
jgi:hypothetical protein